MDWRSVASAIQQPTSFTPLVPGGNVPVDFGATIREAQTAVPATSSMMGNPGAPSFSFEPNSIKEIVRGMSATDPYKYKMLELYQKVRENNLARNFFDWKKFDSAKDLNPVVDEMLNKGAPHLKDFAKEWDWKIERVPIDKIKGVSAANPDKVVKYAKDMASGSKFPPTTGVKIDGGQINVVDGSHRIEAAKKNGAGVVDMLVGSARELSKAALHSFPLVNIAPIMQGFSMGKFPKSFTKGLPQT